MSKKKKLILIISLLFAVVLAALVIIFWDPIIDWLPIDQSGWKEVRKTGEIRYLNEDGDPYSGWTEIESNVYYFDPESFALQTGWLELEDGRYYLGDDGIRRTGWQTINGKKYYLSDTGAMFTGWLEMEEGFLMGFSSDIDGFEKAIMFGPMIGAIPFVGYVFELSSADESEAFCAKLLENADPRWNICTEADETVCGSVDNLVFFVMCSNQAEEAE